VPTPHLLDPRFPARSRLGAYRGIDHLGALRVLSGVFDIAPFDRPVPLWPCGPASEYASRAFVAGPHHPRRNLACAQSS